MNEKRVEEIPSSNCYSKTIVNEKQGIFLSLMCIQNSLFTSKCPSEILSFYDFFPNRTSLIKWMKERPIGRCEIHEFEGRKDIIVVIATSDIQNSFSKECRKEIYRGLHIIYVESGKFGDPYFNVARNVNIGLARASSYSPKWIIFSSDDMYKVDDVGILIENLKNLEDDRIDVVFTKESKYHSKEAYLMKPRFTYFLYKKLKGKIKRDLYSLNEGRLFRKYGISYISVVPGKRWKSVLPFFFNKILSYTVTLDFGILSGKFVSKNIKVFDETYINEKEDDDFSIRLRISDTRIAKIDYKIGDFIGSTLGNDLSIRGLRGVASVAYFNERISKLGINHMTEH